ncbi:phage head closure protein [Sphingomonas cannabina]|uniref:phage head closure protein n=1 Tax=Sphingomonas cannabina TaxID=2899123 RepID=UPI001F389CC7|nr:phage head closure protein [Sphingomonas cannabina]UIJ43721.1 phage head closure protein [Sphingomonas cannabina]
MAGLDAGTLDRRIRIERFGLVKNEYGDWVEGFSTLASVSAQVIPGQGSERLADAQVTATAPAVFVIRWSSRVADLNAKDRIRYPSTDQGRAYDIQRVEEIGRRDGLRIMAVASAD